MASRIPFYLLASTCPIHEESFELMSRYVLTVRASRYVVSPDEAVELVALRHPDGDYDESRRLTGVWLRNRRNLDWRTE